MRARSSSWARMTARPPSRRSSSTRASIRLKAAVRRSMSRVAFGLAAARWPGEVRSMRSIVSTRCSSGLRRWRSSSVLTSTAVTTATPISRSRCSDARPAAWSGASIAATNAVTVTSTVLTARTWDRSERVRIAYGSHRQKWTSV